MDIERLPGEDFEREWREARMDAKRAAGLFREEIVSPGAATNPRYAGGISRYVKLWTTTHAQHIGTLHEIVMPDGSAVHSHAKDYTRRNCIKVPPELERP